MSDWQRSVDAALACHPDHLSAYALIVERGTKLARQIAHGQLPAPDDDLEVDKYEWLDAQMSGAGFSWYELSNWATSSRTECRHNLGYWLDSDWVGIGPGAHSHIAGVRQWNAKHPAAYAQRVLSGASAGQGREIIDPVKRYEEHVLLESRLSRGLPVAEIDARGRAALPGLIADGLILAGLDRVVLTLRGRMLADLVVERILNEF